MHPYELAKVLAERGVPVNRGSLYDTVDVLTRAGWITPLQTERAGARPKRTPYQLTKNGRAELVKRLDEQLRTPHVEFPEFFNSISHIGVLGKERAVNALQERVEHLTNRIDEQKQQLDDALYQAKVPRLFVIEAEYALALLRAEREWVSQIILDIHNGGVSWPNAKQYHKERT